MKKIFLPLFLAALVSGMFSCSDDDKVPGDPEGTVTLNMLDEQNGKTLLDDSGIYIDKAQNFVCGNNCVLFALGKVGGLGPLRPNRWRRQRRWPPLRCCPDVKMKTM